MSEALNLKEAKSILKRFLNAYWLRPETALWRTLDVLSMQGFELKGPSLDVGCGDGTFSFLRAGGNFAPQFDVFLSVSGLDQFFQNVDVYDFFNGETINVETLPSYQIDVGFDHKSSLLERASQLSLYKELVCSDANKKWPFKDKSFSSVFSNIFYWLGDGNGGGMHHAFSELYRVLYPGGKCCLMLPNTTYPQNTFYGRYYDHVSPSFNELLTMIDRGRQTDNIKQSKSTDEWISIIEDCGFHVCENNQHISVTSMQIWDIGLRPIFPLLLKLFREIDPNRRVVLKQEWIDFFTRLVMPIIENEEILSQGLEPTFHCFILQKNF